MFIQQGMAVGSGRPVLFLIMIAELIIINKQKTKYFFGKEISVNRFQNQSWAAIVRLDTPGWLPHSKVPWTYLRRRKSEFYIIYLYRNEIKWSVKN